MPACPAQLPYRWALGGSPAREPIVMAEEDEDEEEIRRKLGRRTSEGLNVLFAAAASTSARGSPLKHLSVGVAAHAVLLTTEKRGKSASEAITSDQEASESTYTRPNSASGSPQRHCD